MTPEADKALSTAKIDIMVAENTVFFSVIMLSLQHMWDDTQPTAYTDGFVVGYNPQFFLKCTRPQRAGLTLHETGHVFLMHVFRGLGLDPEKFNMAADYVVNLIVVEAGFELPPGALYDTRYKGMSTEQVYALLPDVPKMKLPMKDIREPKDPQKQEELKDKLDDILVQAVMQSRLAGEKPGTIPGELERYVDKLLKPEIPWNQILKRFLTSFARDDYSMRKINRRFMPKFSLPGLFSEKVGDIAVGDDVSGSVTQHQHDHFAAETLAILKMLKPDSITFLQFDTRITQVDVLRGPGDMGRIRFKGGGGTDIEPLMKWAEKNKPQCLIVFSDGEFTPAKTNPKIPVFWIINNNPGFQAPFGKVIPYTFNGPRK